MIRAVSTLPEKTQTGRPASIAQDVVQKIISTLEKEPSMYVEVDYRELVPRYVGHSYDTRMARRIAVLASNIRLGKHRTFNKWPLGVKIRGSKMYFYMQKEEK